MCRWFTFSTFCNLRSSFLFMFVKFSPTHDIQLQIISLWLKTEWRSWRSWRSRSEPFSGAVEKDTPPGWQTPCLDWLCSTAESVSSKPAAALCQLYPPAAPPPTHSPGRKKSVCSPSPSCKHTEEKALIFVVVRLETASRREATGELTWKELRQPLWLPWRCDLQNRSRSVRSGFRHRCAAGGGPAPDDTLENGETHKVISIRWWQIWDNEHHVFMSNCSCCRPPVSGIRWWRH